MFNRGKNRELMANFDKKVSFDKIRSIISKENARVHFVGVGGVSMYGLARLSLSLGLLVSGSDREESNNTKKLSELGVKVSIGHDGAAVLGANIVVYSHAISDSNPELLFARQLGIPTVSRAEYMGAVMEDYKTRIGVSGSHGKSTTVAMLHSIFALALTEPTTLSGAQLPLGDSVAIGSRGVMIYEACEYRDSFLSFRPTAALAINLELDHTDYFESKEAIAESFRRALSLSSGIAVINEDDEELGKLKRHISARVVTFGSGEGADYRYLITSFCERGFVFSLSRFGSEVGSFTLNIPGVFNVTNAVGAIVIALEFGIDAEIIKRALAAFSGIPRRLELVGGRRGRPVFYDYAHHPTEIAASINTVRGMTGGEVTVVFKPHTYSRTKSLWEDFRLSLSLADRIILTDIYPAREAPISGVSSARLAGEIGSFATFCHDCDVAKTLDRTSRGAIILMGAGDMENIKNDVLERIED